MNSVKVWSGFDDLNENYRWAIWVDGKLHAFGVETQRQTWKQMDKDKDRYLRQALAGNTEPTDHEPTRIPREPPPSAIEKLSDENRD